MYRLVRFIIGVALGFYFRRIERFHVERVPLQGPILFVSNHPNSLTDSFVIGASVPRKVHFVATVQLFRFKAAKWLLTRCGVIPINRVKDDPKAMRTIAETFEACYAVLEAGEAIGIFPEGITYDDSQLKEIKSGAARMALELEQRHQGKLGLQIVPVGLTFSAKEMYRSDALANFGEPLLVAAFLEGYADHRKECIRRLTNEIERCLQSLIVHIPDLQRARVVAAVKRLYLTRPNPVTASPQEATASPTAELLLDQKIADVVDGLYSSQPERVAHFVRRLEIYEGWLKRLAFSEQQLDLLSRKRTFARQTIGWALLAVLGAPIALYGWAHRLLPFLLVRWAIARFTEPGKRKSQTSTIAIAVGAIGFILFYGGCVFLFHRIWGWPGTLWYALSLPVSGLVAHYYWRNLRRLSAAVGNAIIMVRAPGAAKRVLSLRTELIAEIESVRTTMARTSGGTDRLEERLKQ